MVSWSALLDAIVNSGIIEESSDSYDTPPIHRSGPHDDRPSRLLLVDTVPLSVYALPDLKELGEHNMKVRDGCFEL